MARTAAETRQTHLAHQQELRFMYRAEILLPSPARWRRSLAFCYLEWRLMIQEGSNTDAIADAAVIFNVPQDRIRRWYRSSQGKYPKERDYARELIELAQRYLLDTDRTRPAAGKL